MVESFIKVTRITVKFNDLNIIRNTTKSLSSYFRVPKAPDHLDSIENLQPRRSNRRVPSHCDSPWNPNLRSFNSTLYLEYR